jgi:hypothetical protein
MSRRYATRGSAAWLHLRGRADDRPQGSADTSSGANRFVEELIARVHSDGAISVNGLVVRVDSGFWGVMSYRARAGAQGIRCSSLQHDDLRRPAPCRAHLP